MVVLVKVLQNTEPYICNSVWVKIAENQWSQCLKVAEDAYPSSNGEIKLSFLLPLLLFRPSMNGLDDAQLHLWGWSLFTLLIQMLISPGNIFIDTLRNNVLPAIWTSLNPVKWIHKIHHHNSNTVKREK